MLASTPVKNLSIKSGKKRQPSCKLQCQVVLLDNTTFTATFEKKSAKGQDLYDRVCTFLGASSKEYFGLQFVGWDGELNWLDLTKEIRTQRSKPYHFQFAVKFFPRNPRKVDEVAWELLCLQVKDYLTRGKFLKPVPVKRHAMFDGYFAQFRLGDYNPKTHPRGYLQKQLSRFLVAPNGINSDEEVSEANYEALVFCYHKTHRGMNREEAVLAFLELASELSFYGISLHKGATDVKGNPVLLGLYQRGVLVYEVDRFGEPGMLQLEFAWHEIVTMQHQSRKFHVLFLNEERKDGRNYTFRFHGHYGHKAAERTLKDALQHQKFFYNPERKLNRRSRSFAEPDSIVRISQFDREDKRYATISNMKRSKSSFGKLTSSLRKKLPRRHKSKDRPKTAKEPTADVEIEDGSKSIITFV